MSSNYYLLLEKAKKVCDPSVDLTQKLDNIILHYNSCDFVSSINNLANEIIKEIIILQLYLLFSLYPSSNATTEQTQCITDWVLWVRNKYREDMTNEIFDEIEAIFRETILKKLRETNDLSDATQIFLSSKKIIEAGADENNYLNEIEMKIMMLAWDSIAEVNCGNFNITKIIHEVISVSAAQKYGLNCFSFSEIYLTAILDYLEDNFQQIDINELDCLFAKLSEIQIKDDSLKFRYLNQRAISYKWIARTIKVDSSSSHAAHMYLNPFLTNLKYEYRISEIKRIGGSIFLDVYTNNNELVLCKSFENYINFQDLKDKLDNEIRDYTLLSTKVYDTNCFFKYYTAEYQDNKVSLYMEYHQENLHTILKNNKTDVMKQRFTHNMILRYISNLINTFVIMSASNIKHGSIKPSSFLISKDNRMVLSAQAFSRYIIPEETNLVKESESIVNQNNYFLPPELINQEPIGNINMIEEKSEVFSVGMIIYSLLTLSILNDYSIKDLETLISMRNSNIQLKDSVLMELLKCMLKVDPNERPLFKQCVQFLNLDSTISNQRY